MEIKSPPRASRSTSMSTLQLYFLKSLDLSHILQTLKITYLHYGFTARHFNLPVNQSAKFSQYCIVYLILVHTLQDMTRKFMMNKQKSDSQFMAESTTGRTLESDGYGYFQSGTVELYSSSGEIFSAGLVPSPPTWFVDSPHIFWPDLARLRFAAFLLSVWMCSTI